VQLDKVWNNLPMDLRQPDLSHGYFSGTKAQCKYLLKLSFRNAPAHLHIANTLYYTVYPDSQWLAKHTAICTVLAHWAH